MVTYRWSRIAVGRGYMLHALIGGAINRYRPGDIRCSSGRTVEFTHLILNEWPQPECSCTVES